MKKWQHTCKIHVLHHNGESGNTHIKSMCSITMEKVAIYIYNPCAHHNGESGQYT
uniref:Uncharacterized protein n=1 Tax=Anguilla anguilla TaxID=7936 RepID=A0A0E9RFB7_ANGAN